MSECARRRRGTGRTHLYENARVTAARKRSSSELPRRCVTTVCVSAVVERSNGVPESRRETSRVFGRSRLHTFRDTNVSSRFPPFALCVVLVRDGAVTAIVECERTSRYVDMIGVSVVVPPGSLLLSHCNFTLSPLPSFQGILDF